VRTTAAAAVPAPAVPGGDAAALRARLQRELEQLDRE